MDAPVVDDPCQDASYRCRVIRVGHLREGKDKYVGNTGSINQVLDGTEEGQ